MRGVVDVTVEREGIACVQVFGRENVCERRISGAQVACEFRYACIVCTCVCAEFDLTGGVCGEHFVETEVQSFIAELVDDSWQLNRAAIIDARLFRHGGERRDIDRATRAMFRYDLEACAELLFGGTVRREEYASALPAAGP